MPDVNSSRRAAALKLAESLAAAAEEARRNQLEHVALQIELAAAAAEASALHGLQRAG